MNTNLIYVSKEKAQVSNDKDGTFINEISNGIVINKGDEISIQGVAINSNGVGSDVIEIPSKLKDYDYLPNRNILRMGMYINHNRDFTCKLPTNNFDVPFTNRSIDYNYGYLKQDGVATLPYGNNATKILNANGYGSRYYVGTFTKIQDDVDAVINPPFSTTDVEPFTYNGLMPSQLTFNFLTTDLDFSVDSGYDNPDNIANKITEDFHSADISPQTSVLSEDEAKPYGIDNKTQTAQILPINATNQFISASKGSASYIVFGVPRPVLNTPSPPVVYSLYQSLIGASNPYYLYYGSRIQTAEVLKANTLLNYYYTQTEFQYPPFDGEIITLLDTPLDITNAYAIYNDGYTFATNIPYTQYYLRKVRDFIHSQKILKEGTIETTEGLESNKASIYEWDFILGKYDDSNAVQFLDKSLGKGSYLASRLRPSTDPITLEGGYSRTSCFFDEALFTKAYIDNNGDATIKISNASVSTDGQLLNPKQTAKKYDINVVPIDTGVNGNNQIVMGFIVKAKDWSSTGYKFKKGGFCLIDMTFYQPYNECVLIMNPNASASKTNDVFGDLLKRIQLGSPNINMAFDGTRGRFALENMYFANYIPNNESTDDVVATAGNEVITANYLYSSEAQSNRFGIVGGKLVAFLKYSQSGLGIMDIGLVKEDGTAVFIGTSSQLIKEYEKSLLRTLGFTFKQLTNSYGLPEAIYTNRHYNSTKKLPIPNFFPYPLTNNPEIDTAKNISIATNDSGKLPMFNLNNERSGLEVNISSVSSKTYAVNLPNKLLYPYWLIQSDIIEGVSFNTENSGQPQNIVAVCNRAYVSGDFAFSFQNSYSFKATNSFVLTSIKTTILNPDLSPADVDDRTAVIYQVVSPIKAFEVPEEPIKK